MRSHNPKISVLHESYRGKGLEGWKTVLKAAPTEWLPEPDNPSVRYFALRALMDYPECQPEVVEAKNAMRVLEQVYG